MLPVFHDNNLPNLFIMFCLCSKRLCTYLFNVILGFLCPKISDKDFTSIPHSKECVQKGNLKNNYRINAAEIQ